MQARRAAFWLPLTSRDGPARLELGEKALVNVQRLSRQDRGFYCYEYHSMHRSLRIPLEVFNASSDRSLGHQQKAA